MASWRVLTLLMMLVISSGVVARVQAEETGSGDVPAPVMAMVAAAARLAEGAPLVVGLPAEDYVRKQALGSVPGQVAEVQSSVARVWQLVRNAGAGDGVNPSRAGHWELGDAVMAMQQSSEEVRAQAAELAHLAASGPSADAALLALLIDVQNKANTLSGSLARLGKPGTTIVVGPRDDLQAALDRAQPGDTVMLTAGAAYIGNFRLRAKPGVARYITLTTSEPWRLPEVNRRLTADAAAGANLPQIVTPNNMRALEADPGSHHYRLIGLEVRPANGVYPLGLLALGQTDNPSAANTPHDFVLQHLYVHGDAQAGAKYGIRMEAAQVMLADSTVSDIKSDFQDSQAVTGCNGPGRILLVNNHLEAAGENVMWGACGAIAGVVPSDITMRGNYLFKPLRWKGTAWAVKNSFEIKNGQRIRLEGNVFENNWVSAQPGFMVQLTPRPTDTGQPGVVRDITFVDNTFRNSPMGVNLLGADETTKAGEARQIVFRNNLFAGFGDSSLSAKLFQVLGPVQQLTLDHNDLFTSTGALLTADTPVPGVVFTNNIASHGEYGFWGPETAIDGPMIQRYLPGAIFSGNVVAGGPAAAAAYPANNFVAASLSEIGFGDQSTYVLASASPYRRLAADGSDIGINASAVAQKAAAAINGTAQ